MIANNMFFSEKLAVHFIGKKAWFLLQFSDLHWFKAFLFELSRHVFEKSNVFVVNTVLGHVSVIANNIFFSEKIAISHWKNGLVSLQFSVLHRFKAFFSEFNRLFFEKINVFLKNTVLGQVSVIASNMFFLKN